MAHVEVDQETGIVKMKKFVAVQDMGLVISPQQAESQICGSVIMGIAAALFEQRINDPKTGAFVNAELANYKLPRLGDIGEIVVEFYEPESERSPRRDRPGRAAGHQPEGGHQQRRRQRPRRPRARPAADAAARAEGARQGVTVVSHFTTHHYNLHYTTMKNFAYAAPRTEAEVLRYLSPTPGETEMLAGGTDLVGLLQKMVVTPERVVNLLDVPSLNTVEELDGGVDRDRGHRHARRAAGPSLSQSLPVDPAGDRRHQQHAAPVPGHARRRNAPAAAMLVLPRRPRADRCRREAGRGRGQPLPRDLGQPGGGEVRQRLADCPGTDRPGRDGPRHRPGRGRREVHSRRAALPHAAPRRRAREHARREPAPDAHPAAGGRRLGERHVRSPPRRGPGLSARCRRGCAA